MITAQLKTQKLDKMVIKEIILELPLKTWFGSGLDSFSRLSDARGAFTSFT